MRRSCKQRRPGPKPSRAEADARFGEIAATGAAVPVVSCLQISARDHYPTTQRWAQIFHAHSITADGIVYMSRYMGARKSVALFDRCSAAVAAGDATPPLEHREIASVVTTFELAIERR